MCDVDEMAQKHTDEKLDRLLGQAVSQTGYLRVLAEFTGEYRARNSMAAQAYMPAASLAGSQRMPFESYDDDEDYNEIPDESGNDLDEILQEYEETEEPKRECPLKRRGIAKQVAKQVRFSRTHLRHLSDSMELALPCLDRPIPNSFRFRGQDQYAGADLAGSQSHMSQPCFHSSVVIFLGRD